MKHVSDQSIQSKVELELAISRNRAESERRIAANRTASLHDMDALMADIRRQGIDAESVQELYQSGLDYSHVLPTLIDWLPRVQLSNVKDMLVRSLAVPSKWRTVAPALIEAFLSNDTGAGLRWTVGNSLGAVANDQLFDSLAELIEARQFGTARQMIVVGLGRMKKRRDDAIDLLLGQLDDSTIVGHVLTALRKLRASRAAPRVAQFRNHSERWIRKEAERIMALGPED